MDKAQINIYVHMHIVLNVYWIWRDPRFYNYSFAKNDFKKSGKIRINLTVKSNK